jgi:hypothetical protein
MKKQALDCNGNVLENVNYAVKSQYLLRLLESVPEVASKLKTPGTEEKNELVPGIRTTCEVRLFGV